MWRRARGVAPVTMIYNGVVWPRGYAAAPSATESSPAAGIMTSPLSPWRRLAFSILLFPSLPYRCFGAGYYLDPAVKHQWLHISLFPSLTRARVIDFCVAKR